VFFCYDGCMSEIKNVLVTGGAGYIGGHVVKEMLGAGFGVSVVDDLSTGHRQNVDERARFFEGDFADSLLLEKIFLGGIDAVIHLAARIDARESVKIPNVYFENNTVKTGQLVETMLAHGVDRLIFASSAAVYGPQEKVPIAESAALSPINPYGQSKQKAEEIIQYFCENADLKAAALRFFNVCGQAPGLQIASQVTTSLLAELKAAAKNGTTFQLNGDDFPTPDGSAIRDLVHVQDIAQAHVLVLNSLLRQTQPFEIYNLGTGRGYSVKEIIEAFQKVSGVSIKVKIGQRMPDDIPVSIADITKIQQALNYQAQYTDLEALLGNLA
jgi:UDP-glucose 4-epimerase